MSFPIAPPLYNNWKFLAEDKLKEARVLLNANKYSGAYYLAGYAIEFALKACYCKTVKARTFPPKPNIVTSLYAHDLNNLLVACGVKTAFEAKRTADQSFADKWQVVKDWSEQSRYRKIKASVARDLLKAIDGPDGILNWVKTLW